jgi:hypothetical protein
MMALPGVKSIISSPRRTAATCCCPAGAATDRIASGGGDDLICFGAHFTAGADQAVTLTGSNAFGAAAPPRRAQLRAYQDGANSIVEGDTDGDGNADPQKRTSLSGHWHARPRRNGKKTRRMPDFV